MPEWPTLIIFISAGLALLLAPGPAVLYILARSIEQGRMAGVVSALGVGVGTLVHVAAAALGISAILVSSALVFSIVKYLGAAYLIYLGIRTLLDARRNHVQVTVDTKQPLRVIFRQGVIVNILNPKTALFFFAFLPQFVEPARGSVALQSLLLGTLFVSMGIITDSLYALAAGTVREWLARSVRVLRAQRYLSGGIYILLGLTTAFAGGEQS